MWAVYYCPTVHSLCIAVVTERDLYYCPTVHSLCIAAVTEMRDLYFACVPTLFSNKLT